MGELVNLKEYRLNKEAEESAEAEEEIKSLREELNEIMSKFNAASSIDSYPVYLDEESMLVQSSYFGEQNNKPAYSYLSTFLRHEENHRHISDEEDYFSYLNNEELNSYYIDLQIKTLQSYED